MLVGVADPRDVGVEVERSIETPVRFVGDDHAGFARDQLRTEIVRMAAQAGLKAAFEEDRREERTQIGEKSIVADHEFVELATGRQVLVFECVRFSGAIIFEGRRRDLVVDSGENVSAAGEEAGDGAEAVREILGGRRLRREGYDLASDAIEALGVRAVSAQSPERIAEMLLD